MQLVSLLRLELDCTLFNERDRAQEMRDRARFIQDLNLLPDVFPQLRRLQLMFPGDLYCQRFPEPKSNMVELDTVLFGPLMKASAVMALKEFSMRLPRQMFFNLMELVPSWEPDEFRDLDWGEQQVTRVWYPFNGAQEKQGRPGQGFHVQMSQYPYAGILRWDLLGTNHWMVK